MGSQKPLGLSEIVRIAHSGSLASERSLSSRTVVFFIMMRFSDLGIQLTDEKT